jgi:hypothetical protein
MQHKKTKKFKEADFAQVASGFCSEVFLRGLDPKLVELTSFVPVNTT